MKLGTNGKVTEGRILAQYQPFKNLLGGNGLLQNAVKFYPTKNVLDGLYWCFSDFPMTYASSKGFEKNADFDSVDLELNL